MENLLPCPHCPSKDLDRREIRAFGQLPRFVVACKRCRSHTQRYFSMASAVRAWQKRNIVQYSALRALVGQEGQA